MRPPAANWDSPPLQPDEARQAGINGGLVVEGVSAVPARAGVQPGDVVLAVKGTPAKNIEQVTTVARSACHPQSIRTPSCRGCGR